MSRTTEQNASGADASSAAAEEMAGLSEEFRHMVANLAAFAGE